MFATTILISILASALSITFAIFLFFSIIKKPEGNKKMAELGSFIQIGAKIYVAKAQISLLVALSVIFVILLYTLGWEVSFSFLFGSLFSAIAASAGLNLAIHSNLRTVEASRKGPSFGLNIAFKSGAYAGLITSGLALLSAVLVYSTLKDATALIGLAFGASLISIFLRFGTGIFSKVASSSVGRAEKNNANVIEKDSQNSTQVAEDLSLILKRSVASVADLNESLITIIIGSILLSSLIFNLFDNAILFPLTLVALAIVGSIVGTFFARLNKKNPRADKAIYKSYFAALVITGALYYIFTNWYMKDNGLYNTNYIYLTSLIGFLVFAIITFLDQYFSPKTLKSPKSATAATKFNRLIFAIKNFSLSHRKSLPLATTIILAAYGSYALAGTFGIAIASLSALSIIPIVIATAYFGPLIKNSVSIAQIAGLPTDVQSHLNVLNSPNSSRKTSIKSFATLSAVFASLILFTIYFKELAGIGKPLTFDFKNIYLISGFLIGCLLPLCSTLLSRYSIKKAKINLEEETIRQSGANSIVKNNNLNFKQLINILAQSSISQTALPALFITLTPILVGIFLGPLALGGLIVGTIVIGFFTATKIIDDSPQSTEKQDTDFSINSLIKIVSIVSLLVLPLIALEISLIIKVVIGCVVLIAILAYLFFGYRKK